MRPYVEEFRKVQALSRATGMNPHRWGIDEHVRKGVLVADLFVAAMVVVAAVIKGLGAPIWFFLIFPLPVVAFAAALLLVVSAQSRDEARIAAARREK